MRDCFCSYRSPNHLGGTSTANDGSSGVAFGESVMSLPPLLFRLLPLAGKQKRGVAAGKTGWRRSRSAPSPSSRRTIVSAEAATGKPSWRHNVIGLYFDTGVHACLYTAMP